MKSFVPLESARNSSGRFCYTDRMERVYSEHSPIFIHHLKDILEEKGIAAIIKNEFLSGGAGELPPTEVWPELWVVESGDRDAAKKIVHEFIESTKSVSRDWLCTVCGEKIEGQFKACWSCGSVHSTG